MSDKRPDSVMTGPERIALRQELVDVHGFSTGQAAAIANANTRADMLRKMTETCRAFPKAGGGPGNQPGGGQP